MTMNSSKGKPMNLATRITRVVGSVTLWVLVTIGALSGTMWALGAAGLAQPLIVVSGSMSPEISTGDLLIATAARPHDVQVGEVASLPSVKTGELVTHRVVERTIAGDSVVFRMQGDANDSIDAEEYVSRRTIGCWCLA